MNIFSKKNRSCSRLDSLIVLAWSLKNKELFRIGLVDRLRLNPYKQERSPEWTPWSLKNKEVFRIELDLMVLVLLYALVERVYFSRRRDFFLSFDNLSNSCNALH